MRSRSKQCAVAAAVSAGLLSGFGGSAWAAAAAGDTAATGADSGGLEEITVTAEKFKSTVLDTPISISALSGEQLTAAGLTSVEGIIREVPGLSTRSAGPGLTEYEARGLASNGGAAPTVGFYLDEIPLSPPALSQSGKVVIDPNLYDVERVEVLRGPQGTLFGAGSEGGTVRFITNQPSLTKTSIYGRAETSFTQGGAPSYEAGVAGGTPIIDGTLGIRASVWYRRDGGYIDRIDPTTLAIQQRNANYDNTTLLRLSAIWAPSDNWTVTPSIYYQNRYRNDV